MHRRPRSCARQCCALSLRLAMRMRRLLLLLFLPAFVLPAYLRTLHGARGALERAREQRAHGDARSSVQEYYSAVRWRSPFNSASYTAADELLRYSGEMPNLDEQVHALRKLQSALHAARSFLPDRRAAELKEAARRRLEAIGAGTRDSRIREQYPPRADYRWQFAAQAAFWAWLAAVALLIVRGFDRQGKLVAPRVYWHGALALACWTAWLYCLRWA